jgi:hypothetical protein
VQVPTAVNVPPAPLIEIAHLNRILMPNPVKERSIMPKMMFAMSFGFVALIFATQNAFAAPNCAGRATVLNELAAKYSETRRAVGIVGNSTVMEMFASAGTGTWTLTVTTPDGTTCLVASGDGFEAIDETLPATGDPA